MTTPKDKNAVSPAQATCAKCHRGFLDCICGGSPVSEDMVKLKSTQPVSPETQTMRDTRGKTLDEIHLVISERISELQKIAEQEDPKNNGKFSEVYFAIEELEEIDSKLRALQQVMSDD